MKYCIFVERIFDDETYEKLLRFLKVKSPKKVKLFCLTPANYYLTVSEQGYNGTKEELSNLMFARYKNIEDMGFKINSHLHLSLVPNKMDQEALFKESTEWLKMHDFNPKEIAFGWYCYSDKSLALASLHELNHFKGRSYYHFHDYETTTQLGVVLSNLKHFVLGFKK